MGVWEAAARALTTVRRRRAACSIAVGPLWRLWHATCAYLSVYRGPARLNLPELPFQNHVGVGQAAWAHLDIAGPVWSDKGGATGYGVRTLAHWVSGQGIKE